MAVRKMTIIKELIIENQWICWSGLLPVRYISEVWGCKVLGC